MKHKIEDVLKPLARVDHALTGKYLSHKAHAETSRLQNAIALAKGRAVLVKPTAAQAATLCKVPLSALQNALTRQGLRKSRVPKLAASTPSADWTACVDAAVAEAGGADAVVDYLAMREGPSTTVGNGVGNTAGNS